MVDKNAENDANLMQVALSVEEGSKGTKGAGRGRGQPKQKGGKPKGQNRVKGGKEEHTDKGAGKGNVKDNGKASQSGGGGGSPEGASAEEIKTLMSTMRLVSQARTASEAFIAQVQGGVEAYQWANNPKDLDRVKEAKKALDNLILPEDREFMLIPAAEVKRKVTPAKLKQMVISVGNLHPAAKSLDMLMTKMMTKHKTENTA